MIDEAVRKADPAVLRRRAEIAAGAAQERQARRGHAAEAKTTLRTFQDGQKVAPAVPTPERLTKAADAYSIEDSISVEEVIGEDGRPKVEEIERKRIRLHDAPLARLASRGLLAPGDKFMNMALQAAGEKYAEHWQNGTPSVGAMDPAKPFISDSRIPAYFQSEWQLGEWQLWLAASLKLHPAHRAVVEAVVLHERSPSDIAKAMTGRGNDAGVAIVMDRLICGLGDAAVHFGFIGKNEAVR